MQACLELLRAHPSASDATIVDVRSLDGVETSVEGDRLSRPLIIPFRDSDEWAFAVAYLDCVYGYDSRNRVKVPLRAARGEQKSLFRTSLLAELICGKTDPSEEELSAIVPYTSKDQPTFFPTRSTGRR
ncbi:hypothetical protein DL764_006828 [Monosporascus ibericus]|uniref:Uncharacterized protein n=1 Tax=Monosporascus ibericus TaxID=155417 RepID=A0A4Q4T3R8_9PEZI|nr:hypothetical protein DL764_006828 [Monosporascus ibericus]